MKTILLNTAAAVALTLGMSAAYAQGTGPSGGGGGGGAMEPPAASGGGMGGGAAGSAPSQGLPNRADSGVGTQQPGAASECPPGAANCPGGGAAQGQMKQDDTKGSAQELKQQDSTKGSAEDEKLKGEKSGTSAEGAKGGDATKEGRAAAPKELTSEQKTVIREKVVNRVDRGDRVNVNFNLAVGTVIPNAVHVHVRPLPVELVDIYPAYRGYSYIVLADGRIVIIEPASYEIVTILTV